MVPRPALESICRVPPASWPGPGAAAGRRGRRRGCRRAGRPRSRCRHRPGSGQPCRRWPPAGRRRPRRPNARRRCGPPPGRPGRPARPVRRPAPRCRAPAAGPRCPGRSAGRAGRAGRPADRPGAGSAGRSRPAGFAATGCRGAGPGRRGPGRRPPPGGPWPPPGSGPRPARSSPRRGPGRPRVQVAGDPAALGVGGLDGPAQQALALRRLASSRRAVEHTSGSWNSWSSSDPRAMGRNWATSPRRSPSPSCTWSRSRTAGCPRPASGRAGRPRAGCPGRARSGSLGRQIAQLGFDAVVAQDLLLVRGQGVAGPDQPVLVGVDDLALGGPQLDPDQRPGGHLADRGLVHPCDVGCRLGRHCCLANPVGPSIGPRW